MKYIIMFAIAFGMIGLANAGMPGACSPKEMKACVNLCKMKTVQTCASGGSTGKLMPTCKCKP